MEKIEHIGIAVKNLEESIKVYEQLLNTPCYKKEIVAEQGVVTAFFLSGPNKIELIAPLNSQSPITRFLEKRGEGIHHIAFLVDDIKAELSRLRSEGFQLINPEPVDGADQMWVAFIHPKSTGGTLIELCAHKKT